MSTLRESDYDEDTGGVVVTPEDDGGGGEADTGE